MLFKLVRGEDVFELNPGARAIKEFNILTSSQFAFVSLVADNDYDNPLRTLPDKAKREKAARISGYTGIEPTGRPDKNVRNLVNGKVETVEAAIAEYKRIQFDEDKANLDALQHQIQEIREFMAMDKKKEAKNDIALAFKLANDATKLGMGFLKLKEQEKELKQRIKMKDPVQMNIVTNTSADLVGVPEVDSEGDEMSTIDRVMMS